MRNTSLLVLSLLVCSAAWAADPLLGPGNVGEKDEKGHVRGADSGAGPHLHFKQRPAPRVAEEKKEKEAKSRQEAGTGKTAPGKSGSEPDLQKK